MSNNPSNKKEDMQRGIRSLLGNVVTEYKNPTGILKAEATTKNSGNLEVPIEDILANPEQPRKDFEGIEDLKDSIITYGIIQPLTVKPLPSGKYKLIAGERRLRAAKKAGLTHVPIHVLEANDQKVLELALLENLQREDLNPIEIGESLKRLMDECGLTQKEVAVIMGKERSEVGNYVRLMNLHPDIALEVRNKNISFGHAKAILSAADFYSQMLVYKAIITDKLNVREAESFAKELKTSNNSVQKNLTKKTTNSTGQNQEIKRVESKLSSHFGTKITIDEQANERGKITIEFYSRDQLNGLLEKMKVDIH